MQIAAEQPGTDDLCLVAPPQFEAFIASIIWRRTQNGKHEHHDQVELL